MPEAYVIDAVRTAVGKRNGALAGIHPVDLGALAWRGLLDRADVDLVYRFIRDTTWVSVRWYQPGGPLTAAQVGQQYLAIVLGGITKEGV